MLLRDTMPAQDERQRAISQAYFVPEEQAVDRLLERYPCEATQTAEIKALAQQLVQHVRQVEAETGGMEAFMRHYDLSSEEGVLMMCLAEALLRIPDTETENLLIEDKLTGANWQYHIGSSHSSFVNVTTWGLALTGKVLDVTDSRFFYQLWQKMIKRSGEPVIRQAVRAAIQLLSQHFVLGRTIEEAVAQANKRIKEGYCFSYDMLGEAACTQNDAAEYYKKYLYAIQRVGAAADASTSLQHRSGVSIKLSALSPRYEWSQQAASVPVLIDLLKQLALEAKKFGVPLTVDAEETDRLEMSLDIFSAVYQDPELSDWDGLGLAVQAYQKRAYYVIDWLAALAEKGGKTIAVRLVKGAYWDTEIKQAQMKGLAEYPVFTRKPSTDLNYVVCAHRLLQAVPHLYPQFATHNAYTVASLLVISKSMGVDQFEFQALQGMGQSLHDYVMAEDKGSVHCRIYAPVGVHEDLLPYLVRRLLENGANSSFVNQIARSDADLDSLTQSVVDQVRSYQEQPRNSHIPLPIDIFSPERSNSVGLEISDRLAMEGLIEAMAPFAKHQWGMREQSSGECLTMTNPNDHRDVVGHSWQASRDHALAAVAAADHAIEAWQQLGVERRAVILERVAELLQEHHAELYALIIREAGKTLLDAISELREAIDFCRYYSLQARSLMKPQHLMGYTGESNVLILKGRGPFVCISPWNFPLAIFTGQVVAALVVGNTVLAKPAEQTSLIAQRAVELFHQAGVPQDVLQVLPGKGEVVGAALVQHPRVAGVMFTGSNETAKHIQRALVEREGPIVPFIAETGGLNAMLVDSTALPEQTIKDVIESAFGSAGQRCSACRILLLQDDIADRFITMLDGAMAELKVGDSQWLANDIGPVIDEEARGRLELHCQKLREQARLIHEVSLPSSLQGGTYLAPQAYELDNLAMLTEEVFGPVLHVVRYRRRNMKNIIQQINQLGYGLTFGIQSRIDKTIEDVVGRIHAGNIYVNRNMIGAVVGLQPFGGMGLSGSGPKAGGPFYLPRLCHEVTVSIDTTAAGGNASLMAMED